MKLKKMLGYSYPTSPMAKKHGFYDTGCFYIFLVNPKKQTTKTVSFHSEKGDALAAFEKIKRETYWLSLTNQPESLT